MLIIGERTDYVNRQNVCRTEQNIHYLGAKHQL